VTTPAHTTHDEAAPAFLTHEFEPIGGVIKQRPEDFLVDEIPGVEPTGEGEHTYLLIEKTDRTTEDVARILARHFKVRRRDVGFAGRKDKRAITRQVFSIHTPGKRPEDFPELRAKNVVVLWADIHTNKLRVGDLRGNRFSVRLREVAPMRVLEANRILQRLAREGVPNYFGEQRFGSRGNNHEVAAHIVREEWADACKALIRPAHDAPEDDPFRDAFELASNGEYASAKEALPPSLTAERRLLEALASGATSEQAIDALPTKHVDFLLCALQSALFNRVVHERLAAQGLTTLLAGDLLIDHEKDEILSVGNAEDESLASRVAKRELSPTGPLIGPKCATPSEGTDARAIENRAFDAGGFTIEQFTQTCDRFGITLPGMRRSVRTILGDPEIEGGADEHGPFIRLAFDLPPGGYATSVIREIAKNTHPVMT
jgi:tRNA pseudouridine13 synthase